MPKRADMGGRQHTSQSRRDFLKKTSFASVAGILGAKALGTPTPIQRVEYFRPIKQDAPPITCGLIGFGQWGREIAATIGRMPEAQLVAIADTYEIMLRRAQRSAPDATRHGDYREILDNPDIQSVFVATPTHLHRQIAIDALEAGKHVYCEAPLASTIEDAKAIALAAQAHPDQIFQVGQLLRTEPQYRSVYQFQRSGAIGKTGMVRMQWHSKESWRHTSPSPEREAEANWRLDPAVSVGLIGEEMINQLDIANWYLGQLPMAVTGFGSLVFWNDGRQVPDTVQAIFQYPDGINLMVDATLVSSFDDEYEMFYGSDSTIMLRDQKGWMFKEVDAPMIGWEVYARKDPFYTEKGIALVANATQLDAQATDPTARDPNLEMPIFYAIKEFMENNHYGPFEPSVSALRGYQAAVQVIKANEAITTGTRIEYDPGWFELT